MTRSSFSFVCGLLLAGTAASGQVYQLVRVNVNGSAVGVAINGVGTVVGRTDNPAATETRGVAVISSTALQLLTPLDGGDYSAASAVNDLNQVVGSSNTRTALQAFIWTAARGVRPIGTLPGDVSSEAFGINRTGDVVGASSGPTGVRAFVWNQASGMRSIGTLPGGTSATAVDIAENNVVVGTSSTPQGKRAFVWSDQNGIVSLGVLPGATESSAAAVNAPGQVVGNSSGPAGTYAFVWTSRAGMQLLPGLPGGTFSKAMDINNAGQIVGTSFGLHGQRAVIWTATGVQDLNTLVPTDSGFILLEAHSINARGQIVVSAIKTHAHELGEDGHETHEAPNELLVLTPNPI